MMKKLPTLLAFISCFAWQGCSDQSSTLRAVNRSNGKSASTKVESKPRALVQEQQQKQATTYEQSRFGAEEVIRNPSSMPEDVLQILRRDNRNKTCLAVNETPENIPPSWFAASEINLNNDGLTDLVVTAANPCLFGANVNPFWIFHGTSQGQELVLSVSALALEILSTTTKGHRDIRASSATAREILTTVYSFDGDEYRRVRSSREPISN